jgi:DNA invertase Pin-like site-specific DNA recombinase
MKTILLARVSRKEQEDGQSIPAQTRRLREYAEKNRLTVIHEFQFHLSIEAWGFARFDG